jgi:hypothetical protein
MIVIAFAAVCVPVFVIALYLFISDLLAGMRLSRRANAMVPRTLLSHVHVAQLDAKRTAQTFKAIGALAPRAAMASASILASVNTYRALLARLRDLA